MIQIRLEPSLDCDVAIVGAGPAGAAAACYLARAGHRVLLIDRQRFPRDKICGDFVGPVALIELKRMGITDRPDYRSSNIIREAAVHVDGRLLISHSMPAVSGLPSYGRVIPRYKLDDWIVQAARADGVVLSEGWLVQDYQVFRGHVALTVRTPEGQRSVRSKLLIGADGSGSRVARLMRGHSVPRVNRIVAVRAYYEGIDGDAERADLFFGHDSFPGYCWLFPTGPDTANVGVGMLLETIPSTTVQLRELLTELIEGDPALANRLRHARIVGDIIAWPLATYDPSLSIVADRTLLVGDAAGIINPLNGEGIQYALLSGRWAAEVCDETLRADEYSAERLGEYGRRVHEELRYDMALATIIVQAIRNRSLRSVWLHFLNTITARARSSPNYAHVTGGILAGVVPASKGISPTIIANTVEQELFGLALGLVKTMLRGPRHATHAGLDLGCEGLRIAYDLFRQPVSFGRWGVGMVGAATELLSQAYRHARGR